MLELSATAVSRGDGIGISANQVGSSSANKNQQNALYDICDKLAVTFADKRRLVQAIAQHAGGRSKQRPVEQVNQLAKLGTQLLQQLELLVQQLELQNSAQFTNFVNRFKQGLEPIQELQRLRRQLGELPNSNIDLKPGESHSVEPELKQQIECRSQGLKQQRKQRFDQFCEVYEEVRWVLVQRIKQELKQVAESKDKSIEGEVEFLLWEDAYAKSENEVVINGESRSALRRSFPVLRVYTAACEPHGCDSDVYRKIVAALLHEAEGRNCAGDHLKSTPLHVCVASNTLYGSAIAGLLVEAGASVSAQDKNGDTPLHLAARSGDVASLTQMLQHEGSSSAISLTNNKNETLLHGIARTLTEKRVAEILTKCASSLSSESLASLIASPRSTDGETFLEIAKKRDWGEVITFCEGVYKRFICDFFRNDDLKSEAECVAEFDRLLADNGCMVSYVSSSDDRSSDRVEISTVGSGEGVCSVMEGPIYVDAGLCLKSERGSGRNMSASSDAPGAVPIQAVYRATVYACVNSERGVDPDNVQLIVTWPKSAELCRC